MKNTIIRFFLFFISLLIMALVCGPHSCEWGNTVYFCFGVLEIVLVFLLPFFNTDLNKAQKLQQAFGFSILLFAGWVLLFFLCNFRIMCRLF